jgi:hypothetical protein
MAICRGSHSLDNQESRDSYTVLAVKEKRVVALYAVLAVKEKRSWLFMQIWQSRKLLAVKERGATCTLYTNKNQGGAASQHQDQSTISDLNLIPKRRGRINTRE